MSPARSSSAAVLETAPKVVHAEPAFSEYCQLPFAVPVRATTAIPLTAPGSGSVIEAPMMLEITSPGGLLLFSATGVSIGLPLVDKVGAVFAYFVKLT